MKCPPFAKIMKERMKARGKYLKGWPRGAVVHFTAGSDGAENVIKGGIKAGHTYWCIQRDGQMFCAHDADQWGYHAGESAWLKIVKGINKGLVGAVSDDLIGIEMNAAGVVVRTPTGRYLTWFKTYLLPEDVRHTAGKDNQQPGYYHKYTNEQEHTLIETLLWLKEQNPDVFQFECVLGHDECAGPSGLGKAFPKNWGGKWRKPDPGAALSMTMPQLRLLLEEEYKRRNKK